MRAVLLAAGLGTRLRPLTDARPKCMVPVAGKPVLERNLEWLHRQGIGEAAVNLHYRPDAVTAHVGNGSRFGLSVRYSYEPALLGTAGALRPLRGWLEHGTFVVLYADNLVECDVGAMAAFHTAAGAALTIALSHRDDVSASGVAELGEESRVIRFLEKPDPRETTSRWVSAGLLLCEPRVLDAVPPFGAPDLGRDVVPALLAAGERVAGYRLSPPEGLLWIDTPRDLERAEQELVA